jgi:SAM-dependent methyltransferase
MGTTSKDEDGDPAGARPHEAAIQKADVFLFTNEDLRIYCSAGLLSIDQEMSPFIREMRAEITHLTRLFSAVTLRFFVPVVGVLTLCHFPYDLDPSFSGRSHTASASSSRSAEHQSAIYYEAAYQKNVKKARGLDYEETAKEAANLAGIATEVHRFATEYGLKDKRVLEVGSGRGYLQDIVQDYTGLDISPAVADKYHKPFVVGSATKLPFPDNSFDGVWTVWVLEHISEPERALMEMRRVLKPGGVLFLYVAWDCVPWAADGFDGRPYSDFNWRGKLVKASLPVRESPLFIASYLIPIRAIRWAQHGITRDPSNQRLRFRALEANYQVYWQPDSDAAISLDSFETFLWFRSRGDECLNCGSTIDELSTTRDPLIFRIRKR